MNLTAKPWEEGSSGGICDCCGRASKTVWGDISTADTTLAVYYVSWTVGSAEHFPNIDLVIGPWGDGGSPNKRVLASLLYRPGSEGGSFMVIDSEGRPANSRELCGKALARVEVVGTPLAKEAFDFVDAVWAGDPRIEEVRRLNNEA